MWWVSDIDVKMIASKKLREGKYCLDAPKPIDAS
jgi:hypothetical protein